MNEAELAKGVEDLLTIFHWTWMHQRPAKTDKGWRTALTGTQGFPDYVAVRKGRLIFIELKSDTGKLSVWQETWLGELRECMKFGAIVNSKGRVKIHEKMIPSFEVYVWRPSDYDQIIELLR